MPTTCIHILWPYGEAFSILVWCQKRNITWSAHMLRMIWFTGKLKDQAWLGRSPRVSPRPMTCTHNLSMGTILRNQNQNIVATLSRTRPKKKQTRKVCLHTDGLDCRVVMHKKLALACKVTDRMAPTGKARGCLPYARHCVTS